MPVLEVHLVEGDHAPVAVARLLEAASRRYAEVLESPLERIRSYATLHPREHWAVGGATGGAPAPYFTAIVLEGRPVEQRHRLLADLTDLLVDVRRHPVAGARADHRGPTRRLGHRRRAGLRGPA